MDVVVAATPSIPSSYHIFHFHVLLALHPDLRPQGLLEDGNAAIGGERGEIVRAPTEKVIFMLNGSIAVNYNVV